MPDGTSPKTYIKAVVSNKFYYGYLNDILMRSFLSRDFQIILGANNEI